MAYVELDITDLDIFRIETIEGFRDGIGRLQSGPHPYRLLIEAEGKTQIRADMPKDAPEDAIDLLAFAFGCIRYGGPGDDCELGLQDLRNAMMAQKARDAALRAA